MASNGLKRSGSLRLNEYFMITVIKCILVDIRVSFGTFPALAHQRVLMITMMSHSYINAITQ